MSRVEKKKGKGRELYEDNGTIEVMSDECHWVMFIALLYDYFGHAILFREE